MTSVVRNLNPVADLPAEQNRRPTTTETDERCVIGAAILADDDTRAVMLASYRAADLTDPRCRFVDDLLRRMQAASVPVDQVTIAQFARRQGLASGPSAASLASWLAEVASAAPLPIAGTWYAAAVVENASRRAVLAAGEEYTRVARDASIVELEQVVRSQGANAIAAVLRAKAVTA